MNVALPPTLDILSICTGGGGLDLGIELAVHRARPVCMVEREAFAVAHLVAAMEQGLLAPAPVWSDARTFDGRRWRGCVDGLVGGIPCQPHSLAGRKQGRLDERDLWSDARRIVVQSRSWFVLIENVGGMLSAGADEVAGAERVWRDLRKLGFAVEIGLFTAAEVGASHERERVFILGVADTADGRREHGQGRTGIRGGESSQFAIPEPCDSGEDLADANDQGLEGHGRPVERSGERIVGQSSYELADAAFRRRHHRSAAAGRDGRARPTGGRRGVVADADLAELRREPSAGKLAQLQPDDGDGFHIGVFPPGPADLDGWRRVLAHSPDLEPAVRRMADGVAARVDLSGPHAARVERLRMLGNGVVSLEGAHAFRTLCHRLAGRGSAGAARLVRMMEAVK